MSRALSVDFDHQVIQLPEVSPPLLSMIFAAQLPDISKPPYSHESDSYLLERGGVNEAQTTETAGRLG